MIFCSVFGCGLTMGCTKSKPTAKDPDPVTVRIDDPSQSMEPTGTEEDKDLAPATDKQREQAQQTLQGILLAMHKFASEEKPASLPICFPGDSADKDGKALLSWRVHLLPFLELGELHKKFALDEPWDSKTNKPLIAKMPKLFAPVRVKAEEGHTFYRGFSGNGAFFQPGKNIDMKGIADGLSNTIGVIEAGEAVIWTKPGTDIPFDSKKELPALGKDIDGIFYAATLDGAVHRIQRDFNAETMKAAITTAGGEVISIDSLKPEKK